MSNRFLDSLDSGGIHHDTVGLEIGASDSSAELMQLGQSETLCILDQHDRGIRDIDSDFDYGSETNTSVS